MAAYSARCFSARRSSYRFSSFFASSAADGAGAPDAADRFFATILVDGIIALNVHRR